MQKNKYLFNAFENVYNKNIEFKKWWNSFGNLDIEIPHLAGSSPAVYSISNSESGVRAVIVSLKECKSLKKYISKTVP